MNNKILLFVFGLLVGFYIVSLYSGKDKNRSFDPNIVQLDPNEVTKVIVEPKSGNEYILEKRNNQWTLIQNNNSFSADTASVQSLLSQVCSIQAKRLVSKSKDNWAAYEVDTQNSHQITLFNDNHIIADIIIGKFNFNQQARSASTHVRKADSNDTYIVDGFLSMTAGQEGDAYRNKTLIKLESIDDISQLSFTSNGLTKIINKEGNDWKINGTVVDNAKMTSYLNSLRNVTGTVIANKSDIIGLQPNTILTIQNNGQVITVNAYESNDGKTEWLTSTQNSECVFSRAKEGVYKTLFDDIKALTD